MPDLLLELFSEEIPARMQRKAAADLRQSITNGIVDAGLTYEGAKEYWTPRRLVLDIRGITARSADVKEEKKGPRTDAPEKAIEGFMRGAGLTSIDQAEVRTDPKKGDFYVAVSEKPGRDAKDVIADLVPATITNFSWPKSMRWGEASRNAGSLRWVRPLQSILCVFGPETEDTEVIEFEVSGVKSSNKTYGHRFHAPQEISITRFDDYAAKLQKACIMLDAEHRKNSILTDAKNLAFANGFELVEDEKLLDEVSGLVEWPNVLMGTFDEAFLDIPKEVVQLTIKENQKCFVAQEPAGDQGSETLVNRFFLVSNIKASDDGKEVVRGNGKVVNARLSDAKFFWESDLAIAKAGDGFSAWNAKLDTMTFHAKLGSVGDQVRRISTLVKQLAPVIGCDDVKAQRAAMLCKADLNSAMVYEFPELQGLMGRYYAERGGESAEIALSIEEHYKPLGPSDDIPTSPISVAVALAAKLDVLNGFWSIDEKPTGSKDPYALRRAALGVIRIVIENELKLPLGSFVPNDDLISFFHDRLKVYLRDAGIRHDIIDAVLQSDADELLTVTRKARALQLLIDSDDGKNLLAGYKRAANILAAESKKGASLVGSVNSALLSDDSEIALNTAMIASAKSAQIALQNEDFETAMVELGQLRGPVDSFFENVLVNDDNADIRLNRLILLKTVTDSISSIADFSRISG